MRDFITVDYSPQVLLTLFTVVATVCLYFIHITRNVVEIVNDLPGVDLISFLKENAENALRTGQDVALQGAFFYNNLFGTTTELSQSLLETMQININSMHLIIYHGLKEHIALVTVNPDLSLRVHAQGCIDEFTTNMDLINMDIQFQMAVENILATMGVLNLKMIIIVAPVDDIFITNMPFIPLLTYLGTNPWDLFVYVYDNNDMWFFTNFVSNNLPALINFIQFLVERCDYLFNMSLSMPSDDLAEDSWLIIKAANQLLRYIETIHNIYSPINPMDTEVSRIMEEI